MCYEVRVCKYVALLACRLVQYAERYARGTNVVLLDADVAEIFRNAESVNRALRALAGIIREQQARKPAA
jgi:hypothetical protein